MKPADTFLVILIAGLIPVGIVLSQLFVNKPSQNAAALPLNQTVEQITPSPTLGIFIESAAYASASGMLTVNGKTTITNQAIYYSILQKPVTNSVPEFGEYNDNAATQPITLYALFPKTNGEFTFSYYRYVVGPLLELRLIQDTLQAVYEIDVTNGSIRRQ